MTRRQKDKEHHSDKAKERLYTLLYLGGTELYI